MKYDSVGVISCAIGILTGTGGRPSGCRGLRNLLAEYDWRSAGSGRGACLRGLLLERRLAKDVAVRMHVMGVEEVQRGRMGRRDMMARLVAGERIKGLASQVEVGVR